MNTISLLLSFKFVLLGVELALEIRGLCTCLSSEVEIRVANMGRSVLQRGLGGLDLVGFAGIGVRIVVRFKVEF